ncbi:hypothetical protein C8Q75DRAFT_155499 [Abortiporus biennis]|nr:hypothetical protein C8Q75DRAFT_155499 [Abortiporus biennis]
MADVFHVTDQELSDAESTSSYFSYYPTTMEKEWMKNMERVCDVYETKFIRRFTMPNRKLRFSRLPRELFLLVIDEIDKDNTWPDMWNRNTIALYHCCLTCRAFFNHSQRYLYRYTVFHRNSMLKSFLGSLAQNPQLRGLTTELMLWTSETDAYIQFFMNGQRLLPKLQSVTLATCPVLHPTLLGSIWRSFPTVTSLALRSCNFFSVQDFRRLIENFFPKLSSLEVTNVDLLSTYSIPPNTRPKKAVSLSHLELSDVSGANIIQQWLSSTATQTSLHRLTLQCRYLTTLQSFGQDIHDLRIHWSDEYREEMIYIDDSTISFGPHVLPKLKWLYFDVTSETQIFRFCAVISRFHPSPTFTSIEIRPAPNRYLEISSEAYLHLDNTLAIILPSHTRVRMDIEHWENLPTLKKKGMLAVPRDAFW